MAKMRLDGFINAFEEIVRGMDAAKDAAQQKLKKALDEWAENTARDAEQILARPNWLLSRNITSKSKEYGDGAKIWAMAGFKFSSKEDKRTPGYYGQFHEAGWAPGNRRPKSPDHFLRKAKQKNLETLKAESEKALAGIGETIAQKMAERRGK